MCNINTIIHRKGVSPKLRELALLEQSAGHSFIYNSDGEGVYFSGTGKLIKKSSKINLIQYRKDFLKSRTVITHQRLTTSGHSPKYHHPFESVDFVMVHNGVVSEYATRKASDTHGLFKTLVQRFSNRKKEERTDAIVGAIKDVFDNLSGSWSIVLYDKKTRLSYYFKNSGTSINFSVTPNYLFISTEAVDNLLPKCSEVHIQNDKIYRIEENLDVMEIGSVETKKYEYDYSSTYRGHGIGAGYIDLRENKTKELSYSHSVSKCDMCECPTEGTYYVSDRDEMRLCEPCDINIRGQSGMRGVAYKTVKPEYVACALCAQYRRSDQMLYSPDYEDYTCVPCFNTVRIQSKAPTKTEEEYEEEEKRIAQSIRAFF